MNGEEIIDCFRQLSRSQGFYGRLLREIWTEYGSYENAYAELEEQFGDCKNILDLVMAIEG